MTLLPTEPPSYPKTTLRSDRFKNFHPYKQIYIQVARIKKGNYEDRHNLYKQIYLNQPMSYLELHISTLMKLEILRETLGSVANWQGVPGIFRTNSWRFIKAHNSILLVITGKL